MTCIIPLYRCNFNIAENAQIKAAIPLKTAAFCNYLCKFLKLDFVIGVYLVFNAFIFGVFRLKISLRASAATASALWMAWAYMLAVVLAFECPRRADTVRRFVPAAINSEAFVWRRECSVIGGKSLRLTKSWNHPDTASGFMGSPFQRVKSRS